MLDKIFDIADLVVIKYDIDSDHTTAKAIPTQMNFTVFEVIAHCTTANALGTALVSKNGSAITDAIVMAVDHVVTHAGTIDETYSTVTTEDSLAVICNGAADRGTIYIIGYRGK